MTALTAVLGAGFGAALLGVITALLPRAAGPDLAGPDLAGPDLAGALPGRARRAVVVLPARVSREQLIRAGAALGCAALVGALTRWPVAAVLAGVGAYVLPSALTGTRAQRDALARTEAVAAWAEMLRDNLSTAAGLEQTILVTAPFAPPAIAADITALAAAIRHGTRLPAALAELRERLDDPTAHLIVRALQQAAQRQSRQLAELLSELARRARDRATLRLRIAPGHARIRTNARIIVGFTLTMAAGLVVLNRQFLTPYDTPTGQLVLLVVGAVFTAGFAGIARLARAGLDTPARAGTAGSASAAGASAAGSGRS
jgi:Flp pilus assembly protein TadB